MANASRLPAFFLSCNSERQAAAREEPLIHRLLDPYLPINAVMVVTVADCDGDASLRMASSGPQQALRLVDTLAKEDIHCEVEYLPEPPVAAIVAELFLSTKIHCVELCLSPRLGGARYRKVGALLHELRHMGVLLVCLDRVGPGSDVQSQLSLHDPYWRAKLHHWAAVEVDAQADAGSLHRASIEDYEHGTETAKECLLQASFVLGGRRIPERLLGFDLNDSQRAVTGYGWMK